ncbi:hypothetical protein PSQ90_13645 [Devosia rhodophyticola]|uniref:Uncharacterized protein n=1 Tax=Devosia rhodophyticola TaxID=3026423 RepID=A0ABY7YW90_9HYPH|nr:hypothetical protein [Devosia rhodophyticola]WDR05320.1 hypothetical protein PSQ90_13645 [Devosia rhodophyticola]
MVGMKHMQINRKFSNGMAWAGVVFVVGVVTVDLATGNLAPTADRFVAASPVVAEPVALAQKSTQVAEQRPAKVAPQPAGMRPAAPIKAVVDRSEATQPAAAVEATKELSIDGDAVDKYLASGKALPAYITDSAVPSTTTASTGATSGPFVIEPQQAAIKPVPAVTSVPESATDEIIVSSISQPQKVAPIPMPLSMRPKSVAPLIVDEAEVGLPQHPVPVAEVGSQVLGPDDLSEWTSGSLSDFLARKRSGQTHTRYDGDGFFLIRGHNPATGRGSFDGWMAAASDGSMN